MTIKDGVLSLRNAAAITATVTLISISTLTSVDLIELGAEA